MGRGLTGVVALPQVLPELRKPARSVPQRQSSMVWPIIMGGFHSQPFRSQSGSNGEHPLLHHECRYVASPTSKSDFVSFT